MVLMECLSCDEYMYLRAGMIVLSKIVKLFPTEVSSGRPLSEKIEQIVKRESARGDLQVKIFLSLCFYCFDTIDCISDWSFL
jgi:Transcription factor/nuclear export subunit protein 2